MSDPLAERFKKLLETPRRDIYDVLAAEARIYFRGVLGRERIAEALYNSFGPGPSFISFGPGPSFISLRDKCLSLADAIRAMLDD